MSLPRVAAAFGAGYESALRDPARTLHLHEFGAEDGRPIRMLTERFRGAADAVDEEVIRSVEGPVIDVGCGPGRMVRAGIHAGEITLGIDISRAAVELATEDGLPVLRRSVFQSLPGEGTWGAVLLLDGNIGIGGDPFRLLQRCQELVRARGRIVVETHTDRFRDRTFDATLTDDEARSGAPFPWAEVGVVPLRRLAVECGLTVQREWRRAGRSFASYSKA